MENVEPPFQNSITTSAKIIGRAMAKLAGQQVDGKAVNELVRTKLTDSKP